MKPSGICLLLIAMMAILAPTRARTDELASVKRAVGILGCLPTQFGNEVAISDGKIQTIVIIDLGSERSAPEQLPDQQLSEIRQLVAKWDSKSENVPWQRESKYCNYDISAGSNWYRFDKDAKTMPSSILAILLWVLDHRPPCPKNTSSYCS